MLVGAVLLIAAVLLTVLLGGRADDPTDGSVSVPSPGASGALPAPAGPSLGRIAWQIDLGPEDAVAATRDVVVIGRGHGDVEFVDRATGAPRGGFHGRGGGSLRPVASGDDHVVLAAGERDLVVAEFDGRDTRVGRIRDVVGGAERLAGATDLIRRVEVGAGSLFVLAGSELVAVRSPFDGPTPGELWRWSDQHVLSAGAAPSGPYVVLVDGVVALDADTGGTRWRRRLVTFNNRPHLVVGDLVVIAGDHGQVTALDEATGAVRWQATQGGVVARQLALVEGVVVAALADGRAVAYAATSGDVAWTFERPRLRFELVVAGNGVVVLAGRDGGAAELHVLDATSGALLWRRPSSDLPEAAAGGQALFVTGATGVAALHPRSGRHLWSLGLGEPPSIVDVDVDAAVLVTPSRVLVVATEGGG